MPVALARCSAQALEGLCRRQLLRRAGRPPAAHQGSPCAQRAVHQSRYSAELQRGCYARKIATAQVTAQHPQCQRRQASAQQQPKRTAQQAQRARLNQHQRQSLTPGQAQHTQQRKLLRPLGHAERQHREHQKRTGEQGDQCQHGQVDAVGARQVADALGCVAGFRRSDSLGQLK